MEPPAPSFETEDAAKEFVREHIDIPVAAKLRQLGDGLTLQTFPLSLGDGTFTNVYDLLVSSDDFRHNIEFPEQLTSVFNRVKADPYIRAAMSGGFFLADRADSEPRELGLNLALSSGQLLSFPVVDREVLIASEGRLSVQNLQALGVISINGKDVTWSGSLTSHNAEAKVFGNGNSVITHVANDLTGTVRTLDEGSRYTPVKEADDDTVDVGFMRREDGSFVGIASSKTGGVDTFNYDVALRLHERHVAKGLPEMRARTVGSLAVDGSRLSAVSVGPMLDETDFTGHAINYDLSLGGRPPFLDVPLARAIVYAEDSGVIHYRLFDGRPGSPVFPGVTPAQAAEIIKQETDIAWGCFLGPGQTAKMVTRHESELESHGNRHYLKWPNYPGERFIWVPATGRPVASIITLR